MSTKTFGVTDVVTLVSPQFVREAKVSGGCLAPNDVIRSDSGKLYTVVSITHAAGTGRTAICREVAK